MNSRTPLFWPSIADLFLCSFLMFLGLSITFHLPVMLEYESTLEASAVEQKSIQELEDKNKELNQQLVELQLRYDQLIQKNKDLTEDSLNFQQTAENLRKKLEELQIQLAARDQTIKDQSRTIEEQQLRIVQLNADLRKLSDEFAALKAALAKSLRDHDGSQGKWTKEVEQLMVRIAALEAQVADLQKQLIAALADAKNKGDERDALKGKFEEQGHFAPATIFLTDEAEKNSNAEFGGFSFEPGSASLSGSFYKKMDESKIMAKIVQGVAIYKADFIEVMGHTDVDPLHDSPFERVAANLDWKLGDYIRDRSLIPVKEPNISLPGLGSNMDLGMLRAIVVHHELRERMASILRGVEYDRDSVIKRVQQAMICDEMPHPSFEAAAEVMGRLNKLRYRLYSAGPCVLPINDAYGDAAKTPFAPAYWFQAPSPGNKPPLGFQVSDRRRRRIEIRFAQREYRP
jgi:uncharacterized coiled-coil protein SlyX